MNYIGIIFQFLSFSQKDGLLTVQLTKLLPEG